MLPASLVRQELLHKIGYGRRRRVAYPYHHYRKHGGGFFDTLSKIASTAYNVAKSAAPILHSVANATGNQRLLQASNVAKGFGFGRKRRRRRMGGMSMPLFLPAAGRRRPRRRMGGIRAVDLNALSGINWPVGQFPRALIIRPPLTASGRRRRRR